MPYLETPEELAEEIANWSEVYGCHDERCSGEIEGKGICRVCFTSLVADRIRRAVKNEERLAASG